jgi:hypothetical protein
MEDNMSEGGVQEANKNGFESEFDAYGSAGMDFLGSGGADKYGSGGDNGGNKGGGPTGSGLGVVPILDPLAGVPDTGGNKTAITPDKPEEAPEPETQTEQKEGVKRKARKRSLLNDEEKTVYKRSILGS